MDTGPSWLCGWGGNFSKEEQLKLFGAVCVFGLGDEEKKNCNAIAGFSFVTIFKPVVVIN